MMVSHFLTRSLNFEYKSLNFIICVYLFWDSFSKFIGIHYFFNI